METLFPDMGDYLEKPLRCGGIEEEASVSETEPTEVIDGKVRGSDSTTLIPVEAIGEPRVCVFDVMDPVQMREQSPMSSDDRVIYEKWILSQL